MGLWATSAPVAAEVRRVHQRRQGEDPRQIPPISAIRIGPVLSHCPSRGEGSACPTGLGGSVSWFGWVRVAVVALLSAALVVLTPTIRFAGRPRRHHPHGLDLVHQWRRVPLGRRLRTRGLAPRRRERGHVLGDRSAGGSTASTCPSDGGPQGDDWNFYGETEPTVYTQDSTIQVTVPLHTLALDVKYADGSPAPADVELNCYDATPPGWELRRQLRRPPRQRCAPPSWWRTTRPVTRTASSGSSPTPDRSAHFLVPGNASTYTAVLNAGVHVQGTVSDGLGHAAPAGVTVEAYDEDGADVGQLDGDRCRRPLRPVRRAGLLHVRRLFGLVAGARRLLAVHDAHRRLHGSVPRPRARDRHADRPRPHAGWPARAVERAPGLLWHADGSDAHRLAEHPQHVGHRCRPSRCPGRRQRTGAATSGWIPTWGSPPTRASRSPDGGDEITVVVNPGITITGQVTVPGITTFTDATVTVQSASSGDFATATVAPDGSFTLTRSPSGRGHRLRRRERRDRGATSTSSVR